MGYESVIGYGEVEFLSEEEKMHGVLLIVMGIALQALSYGISGSNVKDFISGLLLGLSIAEMLVGVVCFPFLSWSSMEIGSIYVLL